MYRGLYFLGVNTLLDTECKTFLFIFISIPSSSVNTSSSLGLMNWCMVCHSDWYNIDPTGETVICGNGAV